MEAYDALAELPRTRATGRRDEIGVVEERRTELASLIDRVWPAWRDVLADLVAAGLSPTPDGYGRLLDMEGAAVVHFGDVDPHGVRIMLHLRERAPHLKWFVPDFWFELANTGGLRTRWPEDLNLDFAPAQVRELATRGLWLEQERIALDPRMADALEGFLAAGPPGEAS